MKSVSIFYIQLERIKPTLTKRSPIDPQYRIKLYAHFHEDILKLAAI